MNQQTPRLRSGSRLSLQKLLFILILVLVSAGVYATITRLNWDVQKGDQIKAVIINENTGEVLKESAPITVR